MFQFLVVSSGAHRPCHGGRHSGQSVQDRGHCRHFGQHRPVHTNVSLVPTMPLSHLVLARTWYLVSCLGFLPSVLALGGAVDDAARYFKEAHDKSWTPYEFVESMKKKGIQVPGIGHRIKSRDNRDKRVELLQQYACTHFPSVKYTENAVTVEMYTLTKGNNLVLNVDGCIGALFLDLLESSALFTKQEVDEIVEIGYLNGLFVQLLTA